MMQRRGDGGHRRAAQLDFTYSIGKTGTSSNFRDAWFMGITGQYVAGVWLGNDDFTPMARVTGGSFPAQTWQSFMVQAHDTDNIPQIPGIAVHPVQAAEQARLAAVDRPEPGGRGRCHSRRRTRERQGHVERSTRQVLEKLSAMLKDARPLTPSDASPDRAECVRLPDVAAEAEPRLGRQRRRCDRRRAMPPAEPQTALLDRARRRRQRLRIRRPMRSRQPIDGRRSLDSACQTSAAVVPVALHPLA